MDELKDHLKDLKSGKPSKKRKREDDEEEEGKKKKKLPDDPEKAVKQINKLKERIRVLENKKIEKVSNRRKKKKLKKFFDK